MESEFRREGAVAFCTRLTDSESTYETFYNPVQIFNRDLSLLVVKVWGEQQCRKNARRRSLRFYDAMSASGLRALRVAKELSSELISSIEACDLSESAQRAFEQNKAANGLADDARVTFVLGDTRAQLLRGNYDVVDLDPYGSAVPFLFHALSPLGPPGFPGLLCVTFTDSKVLSGCERHKCYYDYGAVHSGCDCEEENSIRTALYAVSRVAALQAKALRVLLCYQSEFYIRLFLEVELSKERCAHTIEKHALCLACRVCGVTHVHRFGHCTNETSMPKPSDWSLSSARCEECGGAFKVNGPLWADSLYAPEFAAALRAELAKGELVLATSKKITALLDGVEGEAALRGDPRTFNLVKLFRRKGVVSPGKKSIFSALANHGFAFAPSYLNRYCFKTDAPVSFLLKMVREWAKEARGESEINFAIREDVGKLLKEARRRFLPNPEKNWGPKNALKEGDSRRGVVKKQKEN